MVLIFLFLFRKIFTEKFNIGFGYPRKDTCSTCDELTVKLNSAPTPELVAEKELHLRKARVFYDRKAAAKSAAQQSETKAALVFDYQKNLSCPNITTNDVYYKRQLSFYSFNVHNLATDDGYFYCYDETIAKKGADDVASMLYDFFCNILPKEVTDVELFCDSCAGQNKNWTQLRFLHYLVHEEKRFKSVKISFPIRGHSYMECDRDMALVKTSSRAEIPDDWRKVIGEARQKPRPFIVIPLDGDEFFKISVMVKPLFKATCPVPTRPLREVLFSTTHPRLMQYRENWNGPFLSAVMSLPAEKRPRAAPEMEPLYTGQLPISQAKFQDLQVLKRFCSPRAQEFFTQLRTHVTEQESSDSE